MSTLLSVRTVGVIATLAVVSVTAAAGGEETRQIARRKGVALFRQGQKAAERQEWDRAIAAFEAAVAVDPHQVEAQHGLGLVLLANRRYAEAVPALELCRAKYLELAALARIAAAREELGRDEELVDLRNYLYSLNTGRASTANFLGAVTSTEQRMHEIQRQQQRPIEVLHAPARLSLELGVAHHRLGDLEAAEREIREAILRDPGLGDAHASLAAIALETGRARLAAEELRMAEHCRFKASPTFKADVKAALAAEAGREPER